MLLGLKLDYSELYQFLTHPPTTLPCTGARRVVVLEMLRASLPGVHPIHRIRAA